MNNNQNLLGDCLGIVNEERIDFIQLKIGMKLPKSFIDLIRNCDGGIPVACDFEYIDQSNYRKRIDCIGSYLSLNPSEYNDFMEEWEKPPEFFPEGLIAFAGTGGGDYICFDYRKDKNSIDPPIVFWNHEADQGKDVSFVANNFEEFLSILKEPEDIEE